MITKNTSFALGGFLALMVLALVASEMFSIGNVHANPYTATVIGTATTSASVAVTSSTRILATTTNALGNGSSHTRLYATICNPNANPVFISLNNDVAASDSSATYVIAAAAGYSACYELTDRNMYQGSITASSTDETSTAVNVSEYVQ